MCTVLLRPTLPVKIKSTRKILYWLLIPLVALSACQPTSDILTDEDGMDIATPLPGIPQSTPLPTRPAYQPGELVEYTAQTGDTLPQLAVRFNTSVAGILEANPIIPQDATTMPPGMPMQIPIYYEALWGNPYQILPDSLFVDGPAQSGFDPFTYANSQPGWLKDLKAFASGEDLSGGEVIAHLSNNFSISPRLLLALLEYQTQALTHPADSVPAGDSLLGFNDPMHADLYNELVLAANTLNNAYYGYRAGKLTEFELQDGSLERLDPWQNAATAALHYYFSRVLPPASYHLAVSEQGFIQTYTALFGDPWVNVEAHIPGSLIQPAMRLPFDIGSSWTYTGGPHTGWGEGEPFSALDFAPPAVVGGCTPTDEWATAVADGVIARKGLASAMLDLDGDGDEHTGWVVFYLHLSTDSIPPVGTVLKAGDPIGHPSCEGGRSTGTHVHIARKYNGEWVLAEGSLAFNLSGWVAKCGDAAYKGTLERYGRTVRACVCSDQASQIQANNPE